MKKYLAVFIAFVPFNFARIYLYRALLNYQIEPGAEIAAFNLIDADYFEMGCASIGYFNLINAKKVVLKDDVRINKFNRFKSLTELFIGEYSVFVTGNVAYGTRPNSSPYEDHQCFYVGKNSIITNKHSFDISDTLTIGDDVTIAGTGTQFWTHGFDLHHVKIQAGIEIGSHVYIGSSCLVLGGVYVVDNVVIGAGTTVTRSIDKTGFYVSSVLLRKGDVPNYAESEAITNFKGGIYTRRTMSYASKENISTYKVKKS